MNEIQQLITRLRMKVAAHRQFLRDMSETMTEDEKNAILDQIIRHMKIIEELEKHL